jgi:signal peptide peptidase SppA
MEVEGRLETMGETFWYPVDDWRSSYRPYVVRDGILQIPVKGVLLNGFPWADGKWATGYEYIWQAFVRGQQDPDVKGVALVCDTPGGMVAGNFDLVDRIAAWPDRKPLWGFAHESAYSAGYSIISTADKIWVSRSGGVGSIGVVTSHVDWSEWNKEFGLKITYIFAGAHKVDGNPDEPLPDDVKNRIQARIDATYDVFVSTVARNRPQLSEAEVRATEALTFSASEAVSNKLADAIGPFDDALADFSATLNPYEGDDNMADLSQADLDTARTQGREDGVAQGRTEGAAAERVRISAILESAEALARPAAARMLAFDTDKDSASAIVALGKLPPEATASAPKAADPEPTAGAPPGMLDAAMQSGNPDLGSGNASDSSTEGYDDVALARKFGLGGITDAPRA